MLNPPGGRRTAARRLALRRGSRWKRHHAIAPSRADGPVSALSGPPSLDLPWGVECDERGGAAIKAATKLTVWCGASAVGVTQTATKLTDVTETELTEA